MSKMYRQQDLNPVQRRMLARTCVHGIYYRYRVRAAAVMASAVLVVATGTQETAAAAYKFCAFRSGSAGPCTCKSDADGPGQWTVVSRGNCRRADKADNPATAPNAATGVNPAAAESPAPAPAASVDSAPAATAPATAEPAAAAVPPSVNTEAPKTSHITTGALPAEGGAKLKDIRKRGKLLCGVNTGLLGFAAQSASGEWTGLDADFCRAVAAAVFAYATKVEFVPIETSARFEALQSGKVDLLSRNTTWTMNRDVDLNLDFAGVLYLDGQSFMTTEERGLVSAQQLAGGKVCVEAGTTTQSNTIYYFKTQNISAEIVALPSRTELVKAYLSGACDAYSGDRSSLFADRAGFEDPLKHAILPEVISKEPLGPVVRDDDKDRSEIAKWVLAALINAEEAGLDKATAADASKPVSADAERLIGGAGSSGAKLGLKASWLRDVVAAVGNYGEMFEANVGKNSPVGMDRGLNALWKKGGILYAPPMW